MELPDDVLRHIITFIPRAYRFKLTLVSKLWHSCIYDIVKANIPGCRINEFRLGACMVISEWYYHKMKLTIQCQYESTRKIRYKVCIDGNDLCRMVHCCGSQRTTLHLICNDQSASVTINPIQLMNSRHFDTRIRRYCGLYVKEKISLDDLWYSCTVNNRHALSSEEFIYIIHSTMLQFGYILAYYYMHPFIESSE